ncbi:Snf7-domain-containing protein [Parasitella parasitica]|nr:Snf7-domain-containing protein [Parasitella parasitica]
MVQKEYEKQYPIQAHNPSSNTLTWLQWIYYTPYRWVIPETPSHVYIVLPTVREYSKLIVQKHYSKPLCSSLDNLFTFLEFRGEYSTIFCHQETIVRLSDMDLWIILRYLHHCFGVAIADTTQAFGATSTVIKFPHRNEAVKVNAKITENDKAIANLKTACSTLHKQVDELQTKSEEFLRLTREYNTENKKLQAVYMLRKKKHIEEILEQRLKTLETMETILLKIETSQNDLQVIEAFNIGANTLRLLLSGKDEVAETMDKLKDTLEDQNAVEQAIALGSEEIFNQTTGITNEELENELDSIMSADNKTSTKESVSLAQPINTESELLRLQNVLSSLNQPSKRIKIKELA